jgi:archaellum component FlaC
LEHGHFDLEMDEQNKWTQCLSCYATIVRIPLWGQIHQLHLVVENIVLSQNHPLDQLSKCINFVGDHSYKIGKMVDGLHDHIEEQDIKINQLATMVSNLVGTVEAQKELEICKKAIEDQCQIINTMTTKYMQVNDHLEVSGPTV